MCGYKQGGRCCTWTQLLPAAAAAAAAATAAAASPCAASTQLSGACGTAAYSGGRGIAVADANTAGEHTAGIAMAVAIDAQSGAAGTGMATARFKPLETCDRGGSICCRSPQ